MCVCVCVCVHVLEPSAVLFQSAQAPLLLPQSDQLVVTLGSSFRLTCRGVAELVWSAPSDLSEQTLDDKGGLFVSTVTVENSTVLNTGEYLCGYKGSNYTDEDDGSIIYIYVPGMKGHIEHIRYTLSRYRVFLE